MREYCKFQHRIAEVGLAFPPILSNVLRLFSIRFDPIISSKESPELILQKRNSLLQKYYWTSLRSRGAREGRKIGDNLLNMIKKDNYYLLYYTAQTLNNK